MKQNLNYENERRSRHPGVTARASARCGWPLGVRYDCPETGKTLIGASNGVLHLYDNLEADPGNKKMLEVCESKFSHVATTKDFLYGYTVNDELWRVAYK